MEQSRCVTISESVGCRDNLGREFRRVVVTNRWRHASFALVPVLGLMLLFHALSVLRLPDAVLAAHWCMLLIVGAAAVCLPVHRAVWGKVLESQPDFQAWFDECKGMDDIAFTHALTSDVIADCGTNASRDLINEVAGYEFTAPDALGEIATSPGWFDEDTVRFALC